MTCRDICDFVSDYVDGDLPAPKRAAFDAHVAACPNCRRYIDGFRMTIGAAKAAFHDPDAAVAKMPEDLVQAVLRTCRSAAEH